MLVLLVLAFMAAFWVFGRSAFKGLTKWLLWALAVLCAGAGVIALLEAEGKPTALLGGFVLWVFAAYSVRGAGALGKRR